MAGASITAPFKVGMLAQVDETDEMARRVGAVNTLVVRDGRWIGANTDVDGFLTPLAGRMALRARARAVLGAGGAARAVAVALGSQGAAVTDLRATAGRRDRKSPRWPADTVGHMAAEAGQLGRPRQRDLVGQRRTGDDPMDGVPLDGEIVFDLVYAPARTPLLVRAAREGCLTIGGIEMLVAQAERQFELWTGISAARGVVQIGGSCRNRRRRTSQHAGGQA